MQTGPLADTFPSNIAEAEPQSLTLGSMRGAESPPIQPSFHPRSPNPRKTLDMNATLAPTATIRVLLVDDHPLVREGIRNALSLASEVEIIGEAGDANAALIALAKEQPDILVTDLTLPGKGGLELIKDVRSLYPSLHILVITMHDEKIYGERVIRLGALGFLSKDQGPDMLIEAVRTVASGRLFVSPSMAGAMIGALSAPEPRRERAGVEVLTDREFAVFEMIGKGKSAKDIAFALGLSSKTVDVHRANIRGKLNIPRPTTSSTSPSAG
jgi:DNA-binding NarL/FixJ family response regulator